MHVRHKSDEKCEEIDLKAGTVKVKQREKLDKNTKLDRK